MLGRRIFENRSLFHFLIKQFIIRHLVTREMIFPNAIGGELLVVFGFESCLRNYRQEPEMDFFLWMEQDSFNVFLFLPALMVEWSPNKVEIIRQVFVPIALNPHYRVTNFSEP